MNFTYRKSTLHLQNEVHNRCGRAKGELGSLRLGSRQRAVLVAMLRHEVIFEQKYNQRPNYLPFDRIAEKYFGVYFFRHHVKEDYSEWRKCKKALLRLRRLNLIRVVPMPWSSLRLGVLDVTFTKEGRSIARKLLAEEDAESDVLKAVEALKKDGITAFTFTQPREKLWQVSKEKFADRADFEKFWNRIKLGKIIKNM